MRRGSPTGIRSTSRRTSGSGRRSRHIPRVDGDNGRRCRASTASIASRRLRVPTLILHGTEDQAIDVGNAELLAERIPGAELVLLEGAGHLYHSEQAAAADAAVLDFIRRHPDG